MQGLAPQMVSGPEDGNQKCANVLHCWSTSHLPLRRTIGWEAHCRLLIDLDNRDPGGPTVRVFVSQGSIVTVTGDVHDAPSCFWY